MRTSKSQGWHLGEPQLLKSDYRMTQRWERHKHNHEKFCKMKAKGEQRRRSAANHAECDMRFIQRAQGKCPTVEDQGEFGECDCCRGMETEAKLGVGGGLEGKIGFPSGISNRSC